MRGWGEQIDDGYQQLMGDWLTSSGQLGVSLHQLLDQVADSGIDIALFCIAFRSLSPHFPRPVLDALRFPSCVRLTLLCVLALIPYAL